MRGLANHSPITAGSPPAATPAIPTLDIGFADTSADDLSFSLARARIDPLAGVQIKLPALVTDRHTGSLPRTLELNVIGSSHQVILTDADGEPAFIETFACLGEDGSFAAQLPQVHRPDWDRSRTTTGDWAGFTRHEFRCTRSVVPGRFQDAVAEVALRARDSAHHVVVEFPGAPGAITALALTEIGTDGLRWQTWHCYPPTSEIVHSETVLADPAELSHPTDQNRRAPMVDAHE